MIVKYHFRTNNISFLNKNNVSINVKSQFLNLNEVPFQMSSIKSKTLPVTLETFFYQIDYILIIEHQPSNPKIIFYNRHLPSICDIKKTFLHRTAVMEKKLKSSI